MSKRLAETSKLVDKNKLYSLDEAINLVKQTAKAKFDETVEIHIRLGVDPKQSDQSVRGTVTLPNGIGKTRKVVVIARGEKQKEAQASGADEFGAEDLIEKISKGWIDFDVLVATPDTMKDLSKLGKVLGPKGLMPNPKSGTVTFDIAQAVKELKLGRVEYKNDSYGIIHCPVGKASFAQDKLLANTKTLLEAVIKAKPSTTKGQYLKSISISSTMGPGIKLDTTQKF
ncbi:MAG TPA: 50S ribosomal protein L1 [Elusimicrobia bacterium]|nr:MAG: 50S ribosomal protein L1 [Elusimicrobia bacterium RIFOXYA12_FULL_49_49]OGS09822.1 MAG: 50S ribosomal protein L1 [Elusimicrobia bacterium RIFOXYB1_FULL_48_9]OGS09923.1 MAG: 50S ribosomal protein L1 [Elusimicrobia bacterium RIFOXYA1_FULL_47_7]OGS16347.1 MAG: 50S ribosomal protein L1 [Elusimicrobia bacterium RIFOXYA2_FULL_47_53]OGS27272.1 MAG: 50S ribosomal protein L1 [Elusimicrobia bacterium RIFOXYB12_FULL_50_12]OGS30475.1 MAG: 50S ribosomal protein L1 [Elusimicrobia bacterium RIFOXYB2_F